MSKSAEDFMKEWDPGQLGKVEKPAIPSEAASLIADKLSSQGGKMTKPIMPKPAFSKQACDFLKEWDPEYLTKDWDEGMHPRGPDGKFSAGGGGDYPKMGLGWKNEKWGEMPGGQTVHAPAARSASGAPKGKAMTPGADKAAKVEAFYAAGGQLISSNGTGLLNNGRPGADGKFRDAYGQVTIPEVIPTRGGVDAGAHYQAYTAANPKQAGESEPDFLQRVGDGSYAAWQALPDTTPPNPFGKK